MVGITIFLLHIARYVVLLGKFEENSELIMATLTEEEKDFIRFWEKEGIRRKKWTYMLLRNLPKGMIFSAPIAIFFFFEAGKHKGIITHGDLILIMIGVFLIAVFYAVFSGYVRFDRYDSHYKILKMKQNDD